MRAPGKPLLSISIVITVLVIAAMGYFIHAKHLGPLNSIILNAMAVSCIVLFVLFLIDIEKAKLCLLLLVSIFIITPLCAEIILWVIQPPIVKMSTVDTATLKRLE